MTVPDEWDLLEERTEYETGWYDGGYDLLEQPDGSRKRYYWAALPPAVVVAARIDGSVLADTESGGDAAGDEDHLLFVEQYRPAIRETHLELPAGSSRTVSRTRRRRPVNSRRDRLSPLEHRAPPGVRSRDRRVAP